MKKHIMDYTILELHLKFGLFNKYHELVMAVESAEKAFEIAKKYDLEVKELF